MNKTYALKFTAAFKKSYRKMEKRGMDMTVLDDVIEKLRKGIPLEKSTGIMH